MSPQAKTQAADMSKQRQDIQFRLINTLEFDQLAARRLERHLEAEIESPRTTNSVRSKIWHELAYLSAFACKTDQAMVRLDNSRRLGFEGLGMSISMAFLLELGGRFLGARAVIESIDIDKVPEAELRFLVPHFMELGMFKSAPDIFKDIEEYDQYAVVAKEILDSCGVDDSEITERLDFAAAMILKKTKHPFVDYKLFAMKGEGILYQFVAKGSINDLMRLGIAVSDALVDNFSGPLDSILSIDIIPFVPHNNSPQMDIFHASI